ncbi:MAG: DUF1501 domain-containing protein [Opitutaceae bacterium]|jgi:uncharacterized protein (DUF1501 family)|nr:DUF1501 domain-containing protein [Opitutaceae bacterium]
MNHHISTLPATRREFLKLTTGGIGLLAFSNFAPSFLVQSARASTPRPERDRTILVLVQLAGGNDGLNTLIPYEDAHYYRLRPTLGIPKDKVLRITDTMGLHPACAELSALFKDGKLGIIQNVGYPNPNRSHFRSTEIWESATDSDKFVSTGWIGRYLDNTCAGSPELDAAALGNLAPRPGAPPSASANASASAAASAAANTASPKLVAANAAASLDPAAINLGNELPQTYLAARPHSTFSLSPGQPGRLGGGQQNLEFLETLVKTSGNATPRPDASGAHDNNTYLKQTMMDALVTEKRVRQILAGYKPGATYPGSTFGQSLRSIAGLIAANLSTRVYFASLGSFDTHANQAGTHQNLMRSLSEGLSAFQHDLDAHGLADQVLTMTFSEFGRRPMENESKGTDHGTAAPLFVMGGKIAGGLHGSAPSLDLERNQDLAFSTDFRQVYATVLQNWFACKTTPDILGATFKPLGFV